MILRRTDMVVGLFFDLYAPEQNPAVRPWIHYPNNGYISMYPKWINVRSDYVVEVSFSSTNESNDFDRRGMTINESINDIDSK